VDEVENGSMLGGDSGRLREKTEEGEGASMAVRIVVSLALFETCTAVVRCQF